MDQNAVNRARYRANYLRVMTEAKEMLGGKCANCGATDRLEFDHVDRKTKKFNISARAANGMRAIADELEKCQLLCKKCHSRKSADEHKLWHTNDHGGGRWAIRACDCDLCVRKRLDANNERRRRKRAEQGDRRKNRPLRHDAMANNASTGVRGVSLAPGESTYKVQVSYQGKRRYVGRFATLAEAESAAIKAREELHASGVGSGPDTMAQ